MIVLGRTAGRTGAKHRRKRQEHSQPSGHRRPSAETSKSSPGMRPTLLPGLSTSRLLAAILLGGRPGPARLQQLLFR